MILLWNHFLSLVKKNTVILVLTVPSTFRFQLPLFKCNTIFYNRHFFGPNGLRTGLFIGSKLLQTEKCNFFSQFELRYLADIIVGLAYFNFTVLDCNSQFLR